MAAENGAAQTRPKRVQPPNKDEFQRNLTELEKDLKVKEKDLAVARDNVKKAQGGGAGGNDEQKKLKDEVNELKKKQGELKNQRMKIMDEVKMVDERNKKKIKDLNASKAKANFKSVEEIDSQIRSLEKQVDAGNMRLVEEKKALTDISALKKAKKNFGTFADAQAAIDADKAKIASLKASIDKSEAEQVSERFNEVMTQLNALRDEQSAAYKSRNDLFKKRSDAEAAREQVRNQMKELKDTYYGQVRAFNEQRKTEQQARIEQDKAEKAAYEKEKKLQDAQEKLETANEPAFTAQINTAENLLVFFDPTYNRSGNAKAGDSEFAAKASRSADAMPQNAKIIKKDQQDFWSPAQPKKAVKGKKAGSEKFTMDLSIIEDLSNLNITVPSGKEDVPSTIEKLKEKIEYYKENQDRVTKEKVERAKADLAQLEGEEKPTETEQVEEESKE